MQPTFLFLFLSYPNIKLRIVKLFIQVYCVTHLILKIMLEREGTNTIGLFKWGREGIIISGFFKLRRGFGCI